MSLTEKLAVAAQLTRLRVDVIEAGFPASSDSEHEAVSAIAERVGTPNGPVICALARATATDVEACARAIRPAAKRRIHTFLATSDLHLQYKLRLTRAQVIAQVSEIVAYAVSLADDVEFSPEDASRSDPDFLCDVLLAAIAAGATTLNIPDTVGYTTPDEYGRLIARVCALVAHAPRVIVSAHCHDDLGLAVANSLAGVRAGARQVECTVNGIGERAGNASLEEVVMALHTRRQHFAVDTGIDTPELARTSRLVSDCTGVYMPPNKAVVGANAFAHEAGIHQDGMLKHRGTYEIMTPESVGVDGSALVLGRHSGRHAVRARLDELGLPLDDDAFRGVFARFKDVAGRKKTMDDRDLRALVAGEQYRVPAAYELAQVQVTTGTHTIPTATVRIRDPLGAVHTASAAGSGPVDAVCKAIDVVIGEVGQLTQFTVRAVTEGISSTGEATVHIIDVFTGERFIGRGVHTDIIAASAEAYLTSINRLLASRVQGSIGIAPATAGAA